MYISLNNFPAKVLTKEYNLFSKVRFVMDESTTLSDLLALNLHECEEEVKNIVDKGNVVYLF